MAHHSSDASDELRALFMTQVPQEDFKQDFAATFARKEAEMREIKEQLGATGKFPLGKLTPEDEGEIAIGFAHTKGKVVVDFGKPTTWIGFTPEQADEIADTLRTHAAAIRAEGFGAAQ